MPTLDQILFWGATTIVAVDAYHVLFHHGVPNIRTPRRIQAQMIERLKADMATKSSYTIVDLGSGNGRLTRALAKALPEAEVIGLELAPQSIWWANLLKRWQKIPNLEYRKQDFLTYDFAKADAVVMYLIPAVLTLVGNQIHKTARPDTLVMSYRFKLGGAAWVPTQIIAAKSLTQRNLYIYLTPPRP